MIANTLQDALAATIRFKSGLQQHRDYLGISKVAGCPRAGVREYFNGPSTDDGAHRMCFAGYEHEMSIIELLNHAGLIKVMTVEVVAPFDNRLRGHIDSLTIDDDLIEIKSVTLRKFADVTKTSKALQKHFIQVQLYMRYGGWTQAFVVYRCRETYDHKVVRVPYVPVQAERFEQKAMMMLRYIDRNELPTCECGYCK
jgi:hypothetical protein